MTWTWVLICVLICVLIGAALATAFCLCLRPQKQSRIVFRLYDIDGQLVDHTEACTRFPDYREYLLGIQQGTRLILGDHTVMLIADFTGVRLDK